jgi:16S rRNA C1402 (ribose-2'-O) methylase RsmI
VFALLDQKEEEDNGYVLLVNAKKNEDGSIEECEEKTGIWAWKHYHKDDGTTTFKELKGEIVLIIEGCKEKQEVINLNKLSIKEHFEFYQNKGLSDNEAIKSVAKDRNVSKNVIYKEIKC